MEIVKELMKWKLNHEGYLDIKITGACMDPLIKNGQRVRLYPINDYKITTGDIVLVYSMGLYRLHRIVFKRHGIIITKGDNSLSIDNNQEESNVIAILCGVNKFKKVIAWLSYREYKFHTKKQHLKNPYRFFRMYLQKMLCKQQTFMEMIP